MKKKFDPSLVCPFCAQRTVLLHLSGKRYAKREHIPPRSLFSIDAQNLITVPSCEECNYGTKNADEEFKFLLGLYLGEHQSKLWKSALKTFNNNPLYKKQILPLVSPILQLHDGEWKHRILLPDKAKHSIRVVISKLVRGLHWHITNEVVPADAHINIKFLKQNERAPKELDFALSDFGSFLQSGGNTFQAKYAVATDVSYASIWLFRFYKEDCFLVSITLPDRLLPDRYKNKK